MPAFLTQHVTNPTRHRHGQTSSLLDLVHTSDPDMIEDKNISHLCPLDSGDHKVLMWNVICYLDDNNDNPERKIWNYSNTDVTAMNNFLADADWDNILYSDNVNNNWVTFKNIMQRKFVPLQPKKSNKKPPWLKNTFTKKLKIKISK